jgi:tetratricopeptide (TPR) repeat protein
VAAAAVLLAVVLGYFWWSGDANRRVDYETSLRTSPAFRSYQVGIAAAAQGRTKEAETALSKALADDPSNALIYNALATLYVNDGEYQKALVTSENGVRQAPGLPELHYTLGLSRYQVGRYDEAAQALERALELKPDFPDATLWLGNTFLMQARQTGTADGAFNPERLTAAIEQFRKAVAADPGQAHYHAALGEALFHRRDLSESRGHYEEAIALEHKSAPYHIALGKVCEQLDDLGAAEAAFRRAAELDRLSDDAQYGLGVVYFKHERDEEAAAAFREAIRINEFNADAHERLGQTLMRMGQKEEAAKEIALAQQARQREQGLAQLRQLAAEEPGNAEIARRLGIELAKQGDYELALVELRRALSINPRDVDAQYQIGGIYFRSNKILEAIDAFTAVDKLSPGYRWTNHYLAELYKRIGQQRKATERARLFEEQKAKGTLSPN